MWRAIVICTVLALFAPVGELAAQARMPDGTVLIKGRRANLTWDTGALAAAQLEGAVAYFSTAGGTTWTRSNAVLTAGRQPNSARYFPFFASQDGEHHFVYRLRGEVAPGPGVEIPDGNRQKAWFDSTAPELTISSPSEGEFYTRGDTVVIAYTASDVNLNSATGFKVEYRSDTGNWILVTENAPIANTFRWTPPVTEPTNVSLRVTVSDLAGNLREQLIQNVNVGQPGRAVVGGPLSVSMIAPEVIYFENTDFFYEVVNPAETPVAYVAVWYSMDGGATWKTGGANYSGALTGTVVCNFPEGVRRGGAYGNYEQIGFIYQVVTTDGMRNVGDPPGGEAPRQVIPVDMEPPLLHVTMPSLGDKLYRGEIPNNAESGKYVINWGGADRNAIPYVDTPGHERGPVSIWYTTTPNVPEADKKWTLLTDRQPIRRGKFIKTNDLPLGRIQVKVKALDQMGNSSERVTGVIEVIDGSGWVAPVKGRGELEIDRLWSQATQLFHAGEYGLAIKRFDSALEIAPSDRADSVRHDRAVALNADGQKDAAVAELEKVIASSPKNLTFKYTLAAIHYRNDERAKAKEQLDKIVDMDAKEPHIKARSMLATIEHQDGNTARAVTLWEHIVKHGSTGSDEYKNAKRQLDRQKD